MDILYITHFLNGFLMILMPLILGIYLARKFRLGWRLWWIGAATFVLSQIGHLPFNFALGLLFERNLLPTPPESWRLPFSAILLGLSAGLWEESARYITYRWWAKEARSWRTGLMLGTGHGGIEAIILGVLVLFTYANMVYAQNVDLTQLVPAAQLSTAQHQLETYWSAPWGVSLLGALERAFTIPFHLSASLLILQVFVRRQWRWYWFSVGWHTAINTLAVFAVSRWGAYATEAIIGCSVVIDLGIIFLLRKPEPKPADIAPAPLPDVGTELLILPPIEESPENLEETRYN
ncbi:MAG: YhfC family glutamic-type intramembrane protease [Chloroflexota bacterium]